MRLAELSLTYRFPAASNAMRWASVKPPTEAVRATDAVPAGTEKTSTILPEVAKTCSFVLKVTPGGSGEVEVQPVANSSAPAIRHAVMPRRWVEAESVGFMGILHKNEKTFMTSPAAKADCHRPAGASPSEVELEITIPLHRTRRAGWCKK